MQKSLAKIIALTCLGCVLVGTAWAEVKMLPHEETCTTGTFKVDVPKPMLLNSEARLAATENIQLVIDKFRYQAENIGNTQVYTHVTAETKDYVSIFMESLAVAPGVAHGEKDAHALVIAKRTGTALPLSHFFDLPDIDFLHTQGNANYIKVYAADGHTEINNDIIQHLKTVPSEYFLDSEGNVFLVATEMTIYATGTPLLKLPKEYFPYNYVNQK